MIDGPTARASRDTGSVLLKLVLLAAVLGAFAVAVVPAYLNRVEHVASTDVVLDLRRAAADFEAAYAEHDTYQAVAASALDVSEDVTLRIAWQDVEAYCLDGWSTQGDGVFHYNSAHGGLGSGRCDPSPFSGARR